MTTKVEMVLITDLEGNIVAADLAPKATSEQKDDPLVYLVPLKGQRKVSIDVPIEVLKWSGPELQQFFSGFKIEWPADVQFPEIETEKQDKK